MRIVEVSEILLFPQLPQSSVVVGENPFVSAPPAVVEEGWFTTIRLTGMNSPTMRTCSISFEWIAQVCPFPHSKGFHMRYSLLHQTYRMESQS